MQLGAVHAVGEIDKAAGVGQGEHFGIAVQQFFGRVLRHIAGAGNQHPLAFQAFTAGFEHVFDKIHRTVAGGFRAD